MREWRGTSSHQTPSCKIAEQRCLWPCGPVAKIAKSFGQNRCIRESTLLTHAGTVNTLEPQTSKSFISDAAK